MGMFFLRGAARLVHSSVKELILDNGIMRCVNLRSVIGIYKVVNLVFDFLLCDQPYVRCALFYN